MNNLYILSLVSIFSITVDQTRGSIESILATQNLMELDFQRLILEEYTFLKRPFCINGENVTIGNTKEQVAKAVEMFVK